MKKVIDLVGKKIGKLYVLRRNGYLYDGKRRRIAWECQCDCGKFTKVRVTDLRKYQLSNGVKGIGSCGCSRFKNMKTKMGMLTPIKIIGMYKKQNLWLCICDCGKTKEVTTGQLVSGNVKSCGCLKIIHINKVNENRRLKNVV